MAIGSTTSTGSFASARQIGNVMAQVAKMTSAMRAKQAESGPVQAEASVIDKFLPRRITTQQMIDARDAALAEKGKTPGVQAVPQRRTASSMAASRARIVLIA